jgi:HEPN domain-containing protein
LIPTELFTAAENDLTQAKVVQGEDQHAQACLYAQRAAEQAVRALHLIWGQEVPVNAVAWQFRELPVPVPDELIDKSTVLDRYANAAPEDELLTNCGPAQSDLAIQYASEIVAFTRPQVTGEYD